MAYTPVGKLSADNGYGKPGMNILIAEDNRDIQALNARLMSKWGFEYDMVSNGAEAVEYAERNRGKYDLCLMDIEMPVMNGIDAARKTREKCAYFPILALTVDDGHKDDCFSAGMDEFSQKPCLPSQLFRLVSELTTKPLSIDIDHENISITKVMPMNPEELKELRELKKKGLTKMKLVGSGHVFVVHKNIQNKISHDLIGEGKELSEFIDRSPSEPGRCHLYKANLSLHVIKDLFLPEEFAEAVKNEDEIAMKFDRATEKHISDE